MRLLTGMLGAALLLGGVSAQAQQAGSIVVGAGWYRLSPQEKGQPLTIVSPSALAGEVPNTGSSVGNANTLGLTAEYFVTNHVAVEAVFGIPPRYHLQGAKALEPVGELGSAKQYSPSLLVRYHFGEPSQKLRPFAGLGVSYVSYGTVTLTEGFQSTLSNRFTGGATGAGRTKADIDSKIVPVFNAGAAYKLTDRWSISASVSYLPLKTKINLETTLPNGVVIGSETRTKLNPIVTAVAINYTF
jgi:outer membrane protein